MENLFNDEIPMLKLMFYQLDRLISIMVPDLHDHFKDENISSSLFSSSFFITVFTSHMQAQPTSEDNWKIQRIWDHFIVQGWKTLFKICLLILKTYENELLQMCFEELVATLIHLPYRFLVRESEKTRKQIFDIPIEDLGASQIHIDTEFINNDATRQDSVVEFQITDLAT